MIITFSYNNMIHLDIINTCWGCFLVQVTTYDTLLIGRDGHLDQSEVYDIS